MTEAITSSAKKAVPIDIDLVVYFTFHLRDTDNRIKSPHTLHRNDAIARY
jgi:hypothetical protein